MTSRQNIILKTLDLLYTSCLAEGGGGEVIWYSKHFSINEILSVLEEYNTKWEYSFRILVDPPVNPNTIEVGQNQEWITITTDYNLFVSHDLFYTLRIES